MCSILSLSRLKINVIHEQMSITSFLPLMYRKEIKVLDHDTNYLFKYKLISVKFNKQT